METITESLYVHQLSSPEDLVSFIVGVVISPSSDRIVLILIYQRIYEELN